VKASAITNNFIKHTMLRTACFLIVAFAIVLAQLKAAVDRFVSPNHYTGGLPICKGAVELRSVQHGWSL
jgi:hypothetical protein